MAKTRKVSNLLALAVLSYLSTRPMHPYELGRTLRDNGDERSIKFNHGSLYMVIQQLAKAGYVTRLETTRAGQRPERTVYALTDAGRAEFRDWMRQLIAEPQHEYPHFVAALSLIAALPPSEVLPLLRHRLGRLADQRSEIRALISDVLANGVPELFLIEEDYRLALIEAEASFVERFIGRITHPETGWGPEWAKFHGEAYPADQNDPALSTRTGPPRADAAEKPPADRKDQS
jgi:DNA-binding PadR family transcriptional regulator